MTILFALLGLLGFVVCVALPGWLTVRLLDDGDVLWRLGVGLAVGVFAVPALAFLVGVTLHTSVTPTLLAVLGLALDGALLGLLLRWRDGEPE